MRLSQAFRLKPDEAVAFVGSGGKTTAIFRAARESSPALVTTSTHLALEQAQNADRHVILKPGELLPDVGPLTDGVTLISGAYDESIARLGAPTAEQLHEVQAWAAAHSCPLFIEADGARQRPLKAPAEHEPDIPPFIKMVVVTAGLSGLGKPLNEQFVHRPTLFGALSALQPGEAISPGALTQTLRHPQGGLKNIPSGARRVVLLNQADSANLRASAQHMAAELLKSFEAVVITSLRKGEVYAAREPIAGVVLAAGQAARYGKPKQLLDYFGQPFVRRVAETALAAGLNPVVVVTGAYAGEVEAAVSDLPLTVARNIDWRAGQASSLQTGLRALADSSQHSTTPHQRIGGAIFLLADQPQVTASVLQALNDRHAQGLFPIVAPLTAGRRANPALFDRTTFPALLNLQGDVGGRAVMGLFPVEYLPWEDQGLLLDVDQAEDYRRLMERG